LCDGVRRVAAELLDHSCHVLTSSSVEQAEAVHEFRKNCKKMRGLLRLVRPALGSAYPQENSWYRDIARELSGARDAQVLVHTVDALHHDCSHQQARAALEKLREKLERQRLEATAGWIDLNKLLPQLAEQVDSARHRIPDWPLKEPSSVRSAWAGAEGHLPQGTQGIPQGPRNPDRRRLARMAQTGEGPRLPHPAVAFRVAADHAGPQQGTRPTG